MNNHLIKSHVGDKWVYKPSGATWTVLELLADNQVKCDHRSSFDGYTSIVPDVWDMDYQYIAAKITNFCSLYNKLNEV